MKRGNEAFNKPYRPTVDDLHRNGRNFLRILHESWMDYLYWG